MREVTKWVIMDKVLLSLPREEKKVREMWELALLRDMTEAHGLVEDRIARKEEVADRSLEEGA